MLNPTTILIKTAKGEEEIRSGAHNIMPDQRIALSFIDGKSNVSKLLKKAAPSLRSSLPKLLEALSIEGFARDISPVGQRMPHPFDARDEVEISVGLLVVEHEC